MKTERVLHLENQLTMCEAEIERLKTLLKDAKDHFDEKLIELRAEIKQDDSQGEIKFAGAVDAQAEVIHEPRRLTNGEESESVPVETEQ